MSHDMLAWEVHDAVQPEAARVVDDGLGACNEAAAPMHEVRPLSCFVRLPDGEVIGGAVGRTWGECGELLQLWVHERHRLRGIGKRLVRLFEERAEARGCRRFYLHTFSFQAPALYASLGYRTAAEVRGHAAGVAMYFMVRDLDLKATR